MHILNLIVIAKLPSTKAVYAHILTNRVWGPISPHPHQHWTLLIFVKKIDNHYLIVLLCFFFLKCSEIKHLFIVAICISVNCQFVFFTYFSFGLFVFLICGSYSHWILTLWLLFVPLNWLFTLFMVFLSGKKF